jgi:D-alanine-D-alanine ligase
MYVRARAKPQAAETIAFIMLIGLTYDLQQDYLDLGYSEEQTAEFDSLSTIEGIEDVLRAMDGGGHETDRIGRVTNLVERLARGDRWHLVFNVAEGLHGIGRESQVPALLDAYEIPYTFSDPLVCALTLHKGMAKRIVRDLGIPTADFAVIAREADIAGVNLPLPLFAKPVAEGTSKGITRDSKIDSPAQLASTCRRLLADFPQGVLLERYLPGREFTVGIVGTGDAARAIGVMEVLLLEGAESEGYSYANKHDWVGKLGYRLITGPLGEEAIDLALRAWRGLGCRDGGRVDVRQDDTDRLNFIEVNPLPGINPQISDLTILANLAGWKYPQLIGAILESALQRVKTQPLAVSRG